MAGTPASSRGGGAGAGVASVAATDGSIVIAGTAADPTVATGALNAIATAHPPVAAVALNAQKITGLANGAAASDAAAFGQLLATPVAIASGGTGQVTKQPAFDALSPLTTKGDLLGFSTVGVRVAVGTDFLDAVVADAAQAAGFKWGKTRSGLRITGSLFETFSRAGASFVNTATITSGTLRMDAIDLPAGLLITSISYMSGATALITGSNQWFALFGNARNKLAITADDTSTAWAANTVKTLTLTAPFTTTYSGLHYLGAVVVAVTVPTFFGLTVGASGANALAPILCGNADAGLTNPASCPATAAALTVTGPHWAYVN